MDIKIVGATPTDTQTLEERDAQTLEGGDGTQINNIAVHQVLELQDSEKSKYDKEVQTLIEWAKEKTGSDDYTDLKWAIRDLQLKLGTPTYGDRIKNLAKFAYLELEENLIKKEPACFH